jgi:hypothetical protein
VLERGFSETFDRRRDDLTPARIRHAHEPVGARERARKTAPLEVAGRLARELELAEHELEDRRVPSRRRDGTRWSGSRRGENLVGALLGTRLVSGGALVTRVEASGLLEERLAFGLVVEALELKRAPDLVLEALEPVEDADEVEHVTTLPTAKALPGPGADRAARVRVVVGGMRAADVEPEARAARREPVLTDEVDARERARALEHVLIEGRPVVAWSAHGHIVVESKCERTSRAREPIEISMGSSARPTM